MSKSQWQCFVENLGQWQGSFTRLDADGQELEDTPSLLNLEGLNQNQTARLILQFFTADRQTLTSEKVFEFSTLSRSILFFEQGGFSQGSIQLAPHTEFGAEFGLIEGNRRLRLVQLFDTQGQLDRITLIREQRLGTTAPERPPLTLEMLLGQWQGEAITLYPDLRSPDTYTTHLNLDQQGSELTQHLTTSSGLEIISKAEISNGVLKFNQGSQPVQVLLLPDGASCTCPRQIQPRLPLFLEMGWLIQPNLRQRMIRSYSASGEWVSLTLVVEHKQS
ncbi:MAG: DUF3598 family protein [Aphanocapsa sp. GSE-SYN-MK-11-07L]|jgi:hypothetical protein|nr:DUF3598 family protein [Aphanocapsa sp. GSE-SYN-MK-11-07L]